MGRFQSRYASFIYALARRAAECGLVAEDLEVSLESLHPKVPRPLKCRYLFYNVYCRINTFGINANKTNFDSWMALLSKLKATFGVLSEIKQCRNKGAFDKGKSVLFTKAHISDLYKFLVSYAYKWNEIATSLMLPADETKNIAYRPGECLDKVLHAWVTCKYHYTLPPTLEALEKALLSRLVGLGREASELREKMWVKKLLSNTSMSDSEPKKFKIVSQSTDQWIPEGNSLLLEVEAIGYGLTFQWHKDDKKMTSVSVVVDSNAAQHVSIILVKAENLSAEGVYTCHIKSQNKALLSNPMQLTVITPLDVYKKRLTDFYTEQPEVPADVWPPVCGNAFISLALIKQDGIHHAGEYGRGTIQGGIDDIYNNKEGIMYEKAFGDLQIGMRLLIEGRPGSGKTTLVHKITKDWANNLLLFPCVRLVILVHLRAFSSDPKLDLNDILSCYFQKQAAKNIISEYSERHSGVGFCFVVDGLDEYLPNNKNAYIFQLIEKKVLPKAVVIIASRPAAAAPFRPKVTRQVEVIGFLKKQISDYIRNYFNFSHCKCSEIFKYLDQHPSVHHMCYLPIHAAIVCFLFDSLGMNLPETETDIYTEFTKATLLRMLYRGEEHSEVNIESMQDLPAPQRQLYYNVCAMAYKMCKSSKQIMPQSAVQSFFSSCDNPESLGLLTIDKLALRSGFNKMFSFLHLTFQEYLAAYHIANLDEQKQLKLITQWGKARQMQQVWKFFCGLAKFGDQYKSFKAIMEYTEYGDLFKVQCCFESQKSQLCDFAIKHNSLTFDNTFLNSTNFTEISFVLSNAFRNPVTKLSFEGSVFGRECVDVLLKKAKEKLTLLTSLCHYQCQQLEVLTDFLQHLSSLEVLDISEPVLKSEEIASFTRNLSHENLQILKVGERGSELYCSLEKPQQLVNAFLSSKCPNFYNICFSGAEKKFITNKLSSLPFHFSCDYVTVHLSGSKLSIAGARALSIDFIKHPFLTCVTLNGCSIDNEIVSVLSIGLMHCHHLKILDLAFNCIGNYGAIDIAEKTLSCSKLTLLNLTHNNLTDIGALALAGFLKGGDVKIVLTFNNSITKHDSIFQSYCKTYFHSLDISNRDLGDAGAYWLASTIQSSCSCAEILQLHLAINNLSHLAMKPFSSVLAQCNNLLILDLSSNSLGVEGAKILSSALQNCTKLHSLDISSNFICNDGIRNIARVLKCCTNLLQMRAKSNSISCDGAVALIEGLMSCTILQELDVGSNHIQCGGAWGLSRAFSQKCWTNFFVLDISNNNIACEGIKALADGLLMCTSLQELYVSHNNIGSEGAISLSHALRNFTKFLALDISCKVLVLRLLVMLCVTALHSTHSILATTALEEKGRSIWQVYLSAGPAYLN